MSTTLRNFENGIWDIVCFSERETKDTLAFLEELGFTYLLDKPTKVFECLEKEQKPIFRIDKSEMFGGDSEIEYTYYYEGMDETGLILGGNFISWVKQEKRLEMQETETENLENQEYDGVPDYVDDENYVFCIDTENFVLKDKAFYVEDKEAWYENNDDLIFTSDTECWYTEDYAWDYFVKTYDTENWFEDSDDLYYANDYEEYYEYDDDLVYSEDDGWYYNEDRLTYVYDRQEYWRDTDNAPYSIQFAEDERGYYSEDSLYQCDECGEWYYDLDNLFYDEDSGNYYCEGCWRNRENENADVGSVINNYHFTNYRVGFYKPVHYKDFMFVDGSDDKLLKMGFELEVDKLSKSRYELTEEIVDSLSQFEIKNLVNFQNDGSLNGDGHYRGFEIISQPLTMDAHYAVDWVQNLLKVLEPHCKSHDTETCGLHIHVNRDFFTRNSYRKMKAIMFFFKDEIFKMSRRRSWNHRFTDFGSHINKEEFTLRDSEYVASDRYSYINETNSKTIEFRFFRGTLRPESFMAALEFVNNICMIAADETLTEISWDTILDYNNARYLRGYSEYRNVECNYTLEYGRMVAEQAR